MMFLQSLFLAIIHFVEMESLDSRRNLHEVHFCSLKIYRSGANKLFGDILNFGGHILMIFAIAIFTMVRLESSR